MRVECAITCRGVRYGVTEGVFERVCDSARGSVRETERVCLGACERDALNNYWSGEIVPRLSSFSEIVSERACMCEDACVNIMRPGIGVPRS
jgi:hypothetical protein